MIYDMAVIYAYAEMIMCRLPGWITTNRRTLAMRLAVAEWAYEQSLGAVASTHGLPINSSRESDSASGSRMV